MDELHKINAIVVDSCSDTRMRLKYATAEVPFFKEVVLFSSLAEVEKRVTSETEYQVVFLTDRFAEEELIHFVRHAKDRVQTRDAAFILSLNSSEDAEKKTAESLLTGFDGCLVEPYSVDALTDITEIAARVKKERSEEREKIAIGILVKDIVAHVDRIAYIKSCEVDVTNVLKKLRDKNNAFASFNEDMLNLYYQVAIELFSEGKVKAILNDKQQYHGTSERLKKRMAEKILAVEFKKLR